MDDKQKNAIMIAAVAGLAGFNLMWLFVVDSWLLGGFASLFVAAILAAAGYFATQFLS
jgi:hypothetical protein